MAPKNKVTKEDIVNAAVDIVRRQGAAALNARTLAAALDCSTQPVFSNFTGMEQLRFAVAQRAEERFRAYMRQEQESGKYPAYKASGMAYIRFAKEEKELFKLLYMCDRAEAQVAEQSDLGDQMENMVQGNTGLDPKKSRLFHLEMWAWVHGIATMFATNFLDLDWELVSTMLTDAYQGLKKQYGQE